MWILDSAMFHGSIIKNNAANLDRRGVAPLRVTLKMIASSA